MVSQVTIDLCYHGWLRVGTGLSLLEGMIELEQRAEEINIRETSFCCTTLTGDSHPHCARLG